MVQNWLTKPVSESGMGAVAGEIQKKGARHESDSLSKKTRGAQAEQLNLLNVN